MEFSIVYANHLPALACEDYLSLVRHTIEKAGHGVRYSDRFDQRCVNIVLENFVGMDEQLRWVRQNNVKYIVVASERIVNRTFNDFQFGGVPHYSNRQMWKERYDACVAWGASAHAIWLATSDEAQAELYRAATGRPVVELRTPWFEDFEPIRRKSSFEIDFFFSGSVTNHRMKILHELSRFAPTHLVVAHTPKYIRDDQLARSRFCLDIRLCDGYGQISALRVWYLLQNGCHVIAEKPTLDSPLAKYVMTFPSKAFVGGCRGALTDYVASSRIAEEGLQAFREETDAKADSERLIAETFG